MKHPVAGMPAWMTPLSVSASNLLYWHFGSRWPDASEVASMSPGQLLKIRGIGRKAVQAISRALGDVGFAFGMDATYSSSIIEAHRRVRDAAPRGVAAGLTADDLRAKVTLSGAIPTPRADAAVADLENRRPAQDAGDARAVGGSGPEHPAPWRWDGSATGERLAGDFLRAANGAILLSANTDEEISIASPRVRAIIEAAPQMEAIIAEWLVDPLTECKHAVVNGRTDCVHERSRALLLAISERSRG